MPLNPIPGTDDPDDIDGTVHRDLITAGAGNDTVNGGAGGDRIFGDSGDDRLFGDFGDDIIFGGAGDDYMLSSFRDTGDTGYLYGGIGNDTLLAEDITDYSYGGSGDDQVAIYFDLGGAAAGGSGTDTLVMHFIGTSLGEGPGSTDVSVILSGPDAGATNGGQSMELSGFERLEITTWNGDDTVRAADLDDSINVFAGANTVLALGGDDFVSYRVGDANHLAGGTGADTLQVVQEKHEALVLTVSANGATDGHGSTLIGFEFWDVYASSGNDQVQLGKFGDRFHGREGDDSAAGMGGHDLLFGGLGDDALDGGTGNDLIGGGGGQDRLTGGAGADIFRFGWLDGLGDTITDMETGIDHLAITVHAISGELTAGPVDDAHFSIGAAIGAEGQFVYGPGVAAGQHRLVWDANGTDDGGQVLIAVFEGNVNLTAADLLMV